MPSRSISRNGSLSYPSTRTLPQAIWNALPTLLPAASAPCKCTANRMATLVLDGSGHADHTIDMPRDGPGLRLAEARAEHDASSILFERGKELRERVDGHRPGQPIAILERQLIGARAIAVSADVHDRGVVLDQMLGDFARRHGQLGHQLHVVAAPAAAQSPGNLLAFFFLPEPWEIVWPGTEKEQLE